MEPSGNHTRTLMTALFTYFSSRNNRNLKIFITDNVCLADPSLPGGFAA